MSHARLAVLLQRFGVIHGTSASSELRAAYFKKAQEVHPDTGGQHDGADFIILKKEHDEAQALLRKLYPGGVSSSSATQWPRQHWQQVRWEDTVTSRGATEPPAVGRPGAPPLLVWLFSGSFALGGAVWTLKPSPVTAEFVKESKKAQAVIKPVLVMDRRDSKRFAEDLERPVTGYYSKRVKKSEPSDMLAKRPHAKQRGSTYIPPVHAAAEDGMAEWLHFVGERSKPALCDALDKHQQTPLHYAARAGHFDTCAVLLKFQADPRSSDSRGKTPLDLAKQYSSDNDDLIQMLRAGPPGPLANNQYRKKGSLKSQSRGICG
mmetsp:Transcript_3519/g.6912  ORF Transcript_3519/g.6912 Transcript_3519/m.6912 type:complete len:320 (-) Transcript_3519:105-1064(-)